MKRSRTTMLLTILVAVALVSTALLPPATSADKKAKPDKSAVTRTRKTVKMLDDVYKTAVVLITTHYVKDDDDLPAGAAAKALFAAIDKKGWHKVSLLDVSGEPYNDENVAQDAFDKKATKQIKSGKAFVEQVIEKDGKPYLRAATPIPVVLKKCIMCHENYKDAKEGEAIGMLSYTIPIE